MCVLSDKCLEDSSSSRVGASPPPPQHILQRSKSFNIKINKVILQAVCSSSKNLPLHIYTGCNRRNGPDFGRVFLMLNYTENPPKHPYPNFNGYGDIGQRKVWTSLVSAYCTLSVKSYSAYLRDGPRLKQPSDLG